MLPLLTVYIYIYKEREGYDNGPETFLRRVGLCV